MPTPADASVTQLLRAMQQSPDDPQTAARLAEAVYAQLRQIASMRLQQEAHTLSSPTDLVHEAWLRLDASALRAESRAHFFRIASVAMRNHLVDRARARLAQKRGAGAERVSLRWAETEAEFDEQALIDLQQALSTLREAHPRPADVVELRCFGGLELTEIATLLEVSLATVKRDWTFASAWLGDALGTHG